MSRICTECREPLDQYGPDWCLSHMEGAGGPGPTITLDESTMSKDGAHLRYPSDDPTHPDFEWPDVNKLKPAEAGRLLDAVERAATAANKRAKELTARKQQAKAVVDQVLEIYELDALPFTNSEGRKLSYTPYEFDAYTVDDPAAFSAWAEDQDEQFFDSTPRLRDGVFRDEMRRRDQDGEPLPPGVRKYSEQRLSRTTRKA